MSAAQCFMGQWSAALSSRLRSFSGNPCGIVTLISIAPKRMRGLSVMEIFTSMFAFNSEDSGGHE